MSERINRDLAENDLIESNINKDICQLTGNKSFLNKDSEFSFL